MKERLSRKVSAIESSITLEVSAIAGRMRAEGHHVIAFGAGEPDLPTPDVVQDAAVQAIREGRGRYTPAAGIPALREALSARFQADGFPLPADQVMVTAGAKSALFLAFYALLNEGDECVFPAPYWSSYTEMVKAGGGTPVILATSASDDFQPDADRLRETLTDRTRVLLLNSPNNPTGTVYSRETLLAIAEVVRERDLVVITDDIYEHLIYTDEPFTNLLHVAPDLADRTLVINGLSKSHSMTGWRMGFAGGPKALIQAMSRTQSQIAGSPPSITQHAALAAIANPPAPDRLASLDARRRLLMGELAKIDGVTCPEPRGAFYAFPDISAYLGKSGVPDAIAFTKALLEAKLVAAVAGDAFGAPGHIRLTYCTSEEDIREGVRRIGELLSELA